MALPADFFAPALRRVQLLARCGDVEERGFSNRVPHCSRGMSLLGDVDQKFLPLGGDSRRQDSRRLLARGARVTKGARGLPASTGFPAQAGEPFSRSAPGTAVPQRSQGCQYHCFPRRRGRGRVLLSPGFGGTEKPWVS